MSLVASINKTLAAYPHRLCFFTSGTALLHRSGCLLEVSWRYCNVQHNFTASHGSPSPTVRPTWCFWNDCQRQRGQLDSLKFGQYSKVNAISHFFSLLHHPLSNGQAVSFIGTFRHGPLQLKWEGDVGHIVDTYLLAYSMTPRSTLSQRRCVAELFFGRKPCWQFTFCPPKQPTRCKLKTEH
jgi:hypothetical protein